MAVHEVDCLLDTMDSVLDLLDQLDDPEWQVQSLCPAWKVREVVAHLDGLEEALTGWTPAEEAPGMFEKAAQVHGEVSAWSPDRLLARFRDVLGARREELLAAEPERFEQVS